MDSGSLYKIAHSTGGPWTLLRGLVVTGLEWPPKLHEQAAKLNDQSQHLGKRGLRGVTDEYLWASRRLS